MAKIKHIENIKQVIIQVHHGINGLDEPRILYECDRGKGTNVLRYSQLTSVEKIAFERIFKAVQRLS